MNSIQARLLVVLLRLELFANSVKENWKQTDDKWLHVVGWTAVAISIVSIYVHASGMCAAIGSCDYAGPGLYNLLFPK